MSRPLSQSFEVNVRLWPKADIHFSFHDPEQGRAWGILLGRGGLVDNQVDVEHEKRDLLCPVAGVHGEC